MKKEKRLTEWVGENASLILDSPRTEEEARRQVVEQFKKACNKLAVLEDKIEAGTLVEVPWCAVVHAPEERAVREFAEKLRDKEFSAKIGSEWVAVVKSWDIDELAKEVCGK